MRRGWALAMAGAMAVTVHSGAAAQAYPSKPIRLIVPFAPGGGSDIIARLLGQKLNEAMGQPVIIDNRGGAGSTLGTDLAAKSPPDGHTIILNNIGLAFNATLYAKLPYDTLRDLAPIALVATQPNLLIAHPSLPVKSTKDLLALARTRPGQVSYASGGTGSGSHLAAELFKLLAKVDLLHIPYKGTGPALTDLIGGQVQIMISTTASALPHAKSGKLRALGVSGLKRSPAAPDLPTIAESGVPGYEFNTWYGMLAPGATPRPVIGRLHGELVKAVGAADIREKFSTQGLDTLSSTPEEFAAYLRAEIEKWAKVVRASGARGE